MQGRGCSTPVRRQPSGKASVSCCEMVIALPFPRLLPGLKELLWKVLSTGSAHSVADFLSFFLYFWLHREACRILVL